MTWRHKNIENRHWADWAAVALLLCAALLVAGSASAQSERRVALVIGESRYINIPKLPNTISDAQLMADTLKGLGFELVGDKALIDLNRAEFDQAIRAFRDKLSSTTVGLFYYAGHGIQLAGDNYLVPVDANLLRAADTDFELIDANLILRQMDAAGARLNIVLLDACRNNPFAARGFRGASGGLAQMQAPKGTFISFATEPGKLAEDGPSGGNGPYARALSEAIVRTGEDLFQVFNDVGIIVDGLTNGLQRPWVTSSPIEGRFYFATAPAMGQGAQPQADVAIEITFWNSVRESNDPGMLSTYLERYPNGAFAELARRRIALLSARPAAPAPQTPTALTPPTLPPMKFVVGTLDGTWQGVLACGVWRRGNSRNGSDDEAAYTSHDLVLTVKGGSLSGERRGDVDPRGVFAERYSGRFDENGTVVVTGAGQETMSGSYDISFHGKIRQDGDLEAVGSIGARTCTMDYQHVSSLEDTATTK